MNNYAIGIFDSGLGGLNAVKEMMNILPNENIIYFGDTGRVPYGSKSMETIEKFAMQDANFLLSKGVKVIVAACGTVSSVVTNFQDKLSVPYVSVVKPACFKAKRATQNGRIGVIGTAATINSHSYKNRLTQKNPEYKVYEKSCPLFVPLVETGTTDPNNMLVKLIVEDYLKEFKDKDIDTLILGCTHYPLLSKAIQNELGPKVTLVNSGQETALYTAKLLKEHNLLNDSKEKGNVEFFVSDTPQNFENIASLFLDYDIKGKANQIDIEKYDAE